MKACAERGLTPRKCMSGPILYNKKPEIMHAVPCYLPAAVLNRMRPSCILLPPFPSAEWITIAKFTALMEVIVPAFDE